MPPNGPRGTIEEDRPLPEWLLKLEAKRPPKKRKKACEQKKAKKREPEGAKPFPFPIRPTRAGAAVVKYAIEHGTTKRFEGVDLEGDEAQQGNENIVGESEDDKLPDNFLKLDQSTLPLENFDFTEEHDKSPQEWVEHGEAYAAYYDTHSSKNVWRWRKCVVTGYDEASKLFRVRLGAKDKGVSRLNIRFTIEDEEAWKKRREAAQAAREVVKRQLRLDYFVSRQPNAAIRPIQLSTLKGIHARIFVCLKKFDQNTSQGDLLKELTTDAIRAYARAVKLAIVYHRHRTESEFRNEYAKLKLPEVLDRRPFPPPRLGKVQLPSHPFADRRAVVAKAHFSSHKAILKTFFWLRRTYESAVSRQRFVDVPPRNQPLANPPCDVAQFVAAQERHCSAFASILRDEWRTAFAEQILDNIQNVYDFFQSDRAAYDNGPLKRLFKHLQLRMTNQLREVVLASLDDWLFFIRRFEHDATTPLFNVKLKVAALSSVRIEPSFDQVEAALLARVDEPVGVVSELTSIEADIMSLLHLEPQKLLDLSQRPQETGQRAPIDSSIQSPLVKDVAERVDTARNDIRACLRRVFEEPLALADKFGELAWIADIDTAAHVEQFVGREPSLQAYVEEVERFRDAADRVDALSEDEERLGLCAVDTRCAKASLGLKAREVLMALLERVVSDVRAENEATIERYEEILARLGEIPVNEARLAALKQFISDSEKEVARMIESVDEMHKRIATFDAYGIPMAQEDVFFAWSTMEYPQRVRDAAHECETRIEVDKERMIEKLSVEKQKFDAQIQQFQLDVAKAKAYSEYADEQVNVEEINRLQDAIVEAKNTASDFNEREQVFGFRKTEYTELDTIESELNPYWDLWNMISDFHTNRHEWLHGAFLDLDGAKIQREVEVWWKQSYKLKAQLESETPGASRCAGALRDETSEFKKNLPLIQALASPALKERHWTKLSEKIGHRLSPFDDSGVELTLQALLDMNTGAYIEEIQEVCFAAEKEYKLECDLQGMKEDWSLVQFDVKPYKETGTCIVGGIDDIINLLDDHIVKTQTMCGSMFIKPIEEDARMWEDQLKYGQALLDEWIACQRVWMYLEPIFGSEDIMRQLPTESRRFNDVDKLWRSAMKSTEEDPVFIAQADPAKKLKKKFADANEKLDKIQKGLSDYLETKRLFFPRFFFLADEQMLEILSQTKEPRAVQPHLGKAFEGLNQVKFEKDLKITEMISAEGERVALNSPGVDPESPGNKGSVERWLLELEQLQWESVRSQVQLSLVEHPTLERSKWTLNWPAQAVLATSQIFWTKTVEDTLVKYGKLDSLVPELNNQLTEIVALVRGKLTGLQRKTLSALVVMDVHARDTVVTMSKARVEKTTDFDWVSQLRYYWEPSWKDGQAVKKGNDTVVVRIVNARCLYGYEYLGNSMRLVITPLTDRCYRTMISAIDLLYGGAPEGPAGTGKTETVKDLSKAMAIQCVVFNCSDGLDYKAMAKFFKGLAGCGSWSCFDEFNRINVEVLSVIAQQILTINKAKAAGVEKFNFEGTYMKINPNANPFITMNPGYAGRAELPDNLKTLFRPCAMMVPDYALIGEIRLYSFGFEDARQNAQKLVRTLQLCSEQLSSQRHYDYGMRAVNSILVAAGNLRLKVGNDPLWNEQKIVLRSVMDVNLPKFTVDDLPLFRGITSDLFPGVELPTADHGALVATIDEVCWSGVNVAPERTFKLEPVSSFTRKIVQLYEMVLVRHGVMVVGQTLSGKTSAIHALKSAMTLCHERGEPFEKVQVHTMNPKSISSGQLYGNFDQNTHEWSDGILAVIFRDCSLDASRNVRHWILFDGPVDAVWIENMNTVLDDNKKLCLNSGEIIRMQQHTNMMFEAEDLEQASPATVSRVGMIYCETQNVGYEPFLAVWLETLDKPFDEMASKFTELYKWLFLPVSYFVDKFCSVPTPVTQLELMQSSLRLLDTFLGDSSGQEAGSDLIKLIEGLFIQALYWSVGACVDSEGRSKFDDFIRMLLTGDESRISQSAQFADFKSKHPSYVDETGRLKSSATPPEGGYDYHFCVNTFTWASWVNPNFEFEIPTHADINTIVVPTVDTIRHEWLIARLLEHSPANHILCTGETGTGKSISIKTHRLMSPTAENYCNIILNFSAQTSANQTQDIIDNKLEKRRKGVLGPPLGKSCLCFCDDLNMPEKEEYGAQPPIEILRQWMDHAGWYDRNENTFRQLVDIQFIAAMGPPGGGRTQITQRYVRHFNLLNFVPFNDVSLKRVFTTILDWTLSKGFDCSVQSLSGATVDATIAVYRKISTELLPTPTKSFYTFNLRDLSKVIQGLSMVDASTIVDRETFVRLWCHESLRVFHDRLINDNDRRWFFDELGHVVNEKFNLDFHEKIQKKDDGFPIIFGSYLDYTALPEKRLYREVPGEESLQAAMQHFLREYNSNCTNRMSLVLFLNAMEHISRIARIINQPYGNALLMGVGGSGRKSLTTLAVSVCGFEFAQIEISSSYGRNEWCEDLKRIFVKAGAEGGGGNPTVFVFDDSHIVYESFLEDINLILNTGEVPNLFTSEDLSAINDTIAKTANAAGVNTANATEMYKFFISRCRANLHVVICLSPIGDAFRRRLRMFPALVSCTTIDWFTAWPKDALRSVANHFLGEEDMDENTKNGVVDVCVDMQERVSAMSDKYLAQMGRYFYVTPTSYLELINTFKKLLAKQRSQVTEMKLRYDNGLEKILSTETQVDGMQKHLVALQPELKQATIDTDALVETIKVERFEANEVEAVVNTEREACNKQKAEAEQIATSCQKDLAQALPALEAALTALKSLKQSDISEIKAMKKPPDAVKLVLEAVCLMMAVKPDKVKEPGSIKKVDDYWGPAQKHLLGDPKFLSHLVSYDRDNMDPAMVERVVEYTKKDQFQVEVVKKASIAAAGLCKWVCAMMLYDRVAREVAPKKAALTKAEEALTTAQEELADKESALKEVQDKLALLQSRLDAANAKKVELQGQVTDCATKLDRAEQLIKGLGGEKARWTQLSKSFEAKFTNVTGDILLSSGVIAYLGAFVVSYRQDALYEWSSLLERVGIPCTEGFALRSTLGDEVQIREYVINKLPNDEFSVENAIMLERSNRWPLMIDPQGQANNWVKKTYGEQLKVVKLSSQTFARTIENAIPFGHPVLIENVGAQLDPVLEPLLQKQIVVTGGVPQMRFGDATLEYNDAFRLFITTKMRNPHYPPELCVKVTLLNFCATAEGLEDQMLGLAVACEEAELEAQREKLILEDAENKRALAEIEDKILHLLRTSEGNILDDENLIEVLKESKIKSKKIEERVKDAAKTAEIIAQTRKGYQSLAFHASQLFFTIADLSAIDPMYQYSMEWFQALFIDAIGKESDEKSGGPSPSLEERITALKDRFTHVLYLNVCRSLFEKDKLLFSFLLTVKIMIGDLKLDPAHLRYFLAGNTSLEQRELPETECGWLDEQTWSQILGLSKLIGFEDFLDGHFLNQLESWRAIYESKSPIDDIRALFGTTVDEKNAANLSMVEASETRSSKAGGRPSSVSGDPVVDEEECPEAFLSAPFQQLLMLRSIRPDAVVPAVQSFVAYEMGKRFIEVPQFDLEACYNDSKCHTPLLFVLTPGADPMSALYKLAEEKGFIGKKLHAISLGQGQGDIAYQAISEAQDKGTWVCLQNCHLCISWMPTLERLCEELSPDRIQADFRLWLTSEPSKHFPAYILQNGLKMTLEPPKGVRANLIGSYSSMIAPDFMEGTARDADFRKLLFGLCFFHASVRERRKFGPLGWNISYVFSGSDLRISMDQLRIFCVDLAPEEEIPYAALRYLTGECNYGGRVTDDKDRRCLANMLTDFYSQDVVEDDHYKFSPSGTYFAPADGASYMDYILSLPYSEGPELFGLHDNANISCALGETNLLLSTALSLQPRSTGGAGFKSWDETFAEISRGIEAKLPAQFDLEKAVIDFPVLYEESMNTVLTQELLRFNKLTGVIKRSLKEAQRAIKGLVVMSGDLEAMGNSMVDGHVPIEWSTAAYPSRKPLGSWVVDLLQRLDFLRAWSEAKMAPKVFWISGFFFTQAFITGTLQNYARKYQLPIDTVAFDFAFLTPTQEELAYEVGPEDGSICRGLFLEGARWDVPNHVLAESKPRELHTAVPLFHLLPKPKADIEPVAGRPELYTGEIAGTAHVYMCPIYKESTRQGVLSTTGHSTNFVMYIRVPMAKDHDQKHWIKRGVAMLTQKDV